MLRRAGGRLGDGLRRSSPPQGGKAIARRNSREFQRRYLGLVKRTDWLITWWQRNALRVHRTVNVSKNVQQLQLVVDFCAVYFVCEKSLLQSRSVQHQWWEFQVFFVPQVNRCGSFYWPGFTSCFFFNFLSRCQVTCLSCLFWSLPSRGSHIRLTTFNIDTKADIF